MGTSTGNPLPAPIQILHIVTAEIMPSGRGGSLRTIPFQLSAVPSDEWVDAFVRTWDHPPQFGSMHQPGIARVDGDRVILDGTTVEIVERHHRATLVLVLNEVNKQILARAAASQQTAVIEAEHAAAAERQLNEERKKAARIRFE